MALQLYRWPFRLSTVASVVTGRLLADPADITSLLVFMTGDPTIRFDHNSAVIAAPRCAEALRRQYPALADLALPAVPATADTATVDRDRPAVLDQWLAEIATILGYGTLPDPWLTVQPCDGVRPCDG